MALLVHLPLLGNLNNQGLAELSSITLVSDNSFVTGGKIGSQSLAITKQQPILSTSSCMSNKKQMSYAFWIKVNNAWETDWLDGIRWVSTDGSATHVSRQEFYSNCTRVGTWFKGDALSGYSFVVGEWTHLVGTYDYDTGIACFYINGVLQGTKSTLDTTHYCRGDFYIGDNNVDVIMNDVRIYDSVLSPMEVKHLSQGLVLHYPLDGNNGTLVNENLLHGSNVIGSGTTIYGWVSNGSATGMEILSDGSLHYKYNISNSKNIPSITTNTVVPCEFSKTYFYSMDLKFDKAITLGLSTPAHFWVGARNSNSITNTSCSGNLTGIQTEYISNVLTETTTGEVNVWMKNCKVEEGHTPTPWCPNSSDALYTALGYDDGIEYDTSGYGNNGTKINELSYSSNSLRYLSSTVFNSSKRTGISFSNESNPREQLTISLWGYKDNWDFAERLGGKAASASGWCIGDYGSENTMFGFFLESGNGGYNTITGFRQLSSGWHHFVITFDGFNLKYYLDGECINTISWNTQQYFKRGVGDYYLGSHTNNGMFFNGNLSDFRIYASCLSPLDVEALYKTSGAVDSNGNFYAYEYIEN